MKKLLNFKTLNSSLSYSKKNLEVLKRNLNYFFLNIKKNKILELESAEGRFKNLNIKNVLKRGYSIVRSHNKKNIIKTHKIKEGSLIDIELYDGIVVASINSKT